MGSIPAGDASFFKSSTAEFGLVLPVKPMQFRGGNPPELMLTRLTVLAVIAFAAVLSARADDALQEGDWKIHVELHTITLPEKNALALLPELRDETTIAAGWAKLEAMIAKDEAKVFAVLIGEGKDGEKIEARQGEEVRYATEFSPPSLVEPGAGQSKEPAKGPQAVSFGPTAFEKRDIGIAFTAELSVSADGRRVHMAATPEHTWLLGWEDFENGRLPNNEKIFIKQPRFAVVKTSGHFAMNSGERTLLSIHRVPGRENTMEFFLLRAWTTPRKPAAAK